MQIINEINEIIPNKLFLVVFFFIISIIIHIPIIKFKIFVIIIIKIYKLLILNLIFRKSIIVTMLNNNNKIARTIWQANLPLVEVFLSS